MDSQVNIPSPLTAAMQPGWQLVDDLAGGTTAMRAAGTRYLPKRPLEEQSDYDARLASATLLPAFSETVARMTGRIFAEPLVVGENVPGWIMDEVLPDVDRQGRNLHVFAREWFSEALSYGLSHCLVESPRADGIRTRADQRAAKVRPYAIRIHPRRILGWREHDGELVQLRVRFQRVEDDGEFGSKTVEQVRVYESGRVRTYEKVERGTERNAWLQVDEVQTGLARIPLITLYTQRTGMLTATPPLLELAHLNAKHWRMQSSNDTLIDTASVPILALSGINEGDDVIIGAKHAIRLPTGATAKYVEHTGAAIGAGRQSLVDLVEDMRRAGAKLLQPADASKTATEAREDAAADNSALGGMATQLQDTLIDLLDLIAEYRGEATGGTVEVRPNLDPDPTPANTLTTLIGLRNAGALSDETLFGEAQRRGLVASDVAWADEAERIAAQGL